MTAGQVLVIAKSPQPGRVKTRLCPPCTPRQAASLAAAALDDTLRAARDADVSRRILALTGDTEAVRALDLSGLDVVPQRGDRLAARLANAFADTIGAPTVLIGMDTPQVTAADLDFALSQLSTADAAIGHAEDGGWWTLALRDPSHADLLANIPTSTSDTGRLTEAALLERGLTVRRLRVLRDVDTIADAHAVASIAPDTEFARRLGALSGCLPVAT